MKVSILIILSIVLHVNTIKFYRSERRLPVYRAFPCVNDETIVSSFQEGLKNGYNITINKDLEKETNIDLMFDVLAAVFTDVESASSEEDDIQNMFRIKLRKSSFKFTFNVRGDEVPFAPPYLTSLKINGEEFCSQPNETYFTHFNVGVLSNVVRHCGRRFIYHTALILGGSDTKPGDWPWHAALYKRTDSVFRYACGGTLISKYFVLTAAHCTKKSRENNDVISPDRLRIELGRYNLSLSDEIGSQINYVDRIYVHPEFTHLILKNDIALLKLSTEVVYTKYVQAACLWKNTVLDRLPFGSLGTVVGWGYNQNYVHNLSSTLHAAKIPQVPKYDCISRQANFYNSMLRHGLTFCAGYTNGTSACNGDSGGGYVHFVPDLRVDSTSDSYLHVPGAYHVKGIVSNTLATEGSICDPYAYVIFTDVAKYLDWIYSVIDPTHSDTTKSKMPRAYERKTDRSSYPKEINQNADEVAGGKLVFNTFI